MTTRMKLTRQKGLTMIELMTTMLISTVIMLGITGMLVDNLRGWKTMYDRLHSPEADNTYVMRKMFDRAVRQATSASVYSPTVSPTSATIFYYDHRGSTFVDRRATFTFTSGSPSGTLGITVNSVNVLGTIGGTVFTQTIQNVVPMATGSNPFKLSGRSVQMLLTIQNNNNTPTENFSEKLNVLTSGYINNW